MADPDVPKQSYFPLMSLPPELRFMIYREHFFQEGRPRGVRRLRSPVLSCEHMGVRRLMLVSKAIYHESMPFYFRTMNFQFNFASNLEEFLERTGKYQRQHITQITIHLAHSDSSLKQACQNLFRCPALESLSFSLSAVVKILNHPAAWKHLLRIHGLKFLNIRANQFAQLPTHCIPLTGNLRPLRTLLEPYDEATIKQREARGIIKSKDLREVFVNEYTREGRRACRARYKEITEA